MTISARNHLLLLAAALCCIPSHAALGLRRTGSATGYRRRATTEFDALFQDDSRA